MERPARRLGSRRPETPLMPRCQRADLDVKVEICQAFVRRKSDFWRFYIRREMENPLFLQGVKEWCTHEELNLKPADP